MRQVIRRMKRRGFTLVELMIVVAIVGVLAVLAVYGVRKYIANSKTAEARNGIGQIAKDQVAAYEKENVSTTVLPMGNSTQVLRALCPSAGGPVPATAPAGMKYQSTVANWHDGLGWDCLGYTMDSPQYFSYNFTGGTTATTFVATANGDLNGDGIQSTFTLNGAVQSGIVTVAPSMQEVNPAE